MTLLRDSSVVQLPDSRILISADDEETLRSQKQQSQQLPMRQTAAPSFATSSRVS